jgi:hypothetical protein
MNYLVKKLMVVLSILTIAMGLMGAREVDEKDFSGWMSQYKQLSFDEKRNLFLFMKEESKGQYQKIMVQPVEVYTAKEQPTNDISEKSASYLEEGINAMLKERGVLTDKAGEGVLILKVAITGTEKSKEDLKARNFVPVAAIFRAGQAASGKVATYIDAMMEAEMVDSVSGERVAAVVAKTIDETEKRSGDQLAFSDITPVLDIWLKRYEGTVSALMAK